MKTIHPAVLALLTLSALCAAPAPAARAAEDEGGRVLVLCYHDVPVDARNDPDAVELANFVEQIEYMRLHGAHFIRPDDIEAARGGGPALPGQPVLLSFDDGYQTFLTNVLPVLELYQIPAMLSLCTGWIESGPPEDIPAPILTWDQVRTLADHRLVTLASHSHDLHRAVLCNPQSNTAHAAVTRLYDAQTGAYETDAAWRARLATDLAETKQIFRARVGREPRIIVWPYGEYNAMAREEAERAGFRLAFRLQNTRARSDDLMALDRWMIIGNPPILDFAEDWRMHTELAELPRPPMRALQADLDMICDPSPEQQERNLGRFLDRVVAMRPSAVFLQAFADPDGDGTVDAVYFPNRLLPMRADLFSRVANQLYIRGFTVFAWMPALAIELPDAERTRALRVLESADGGTPRLATSWYRRLSPFAPETTELLGALYADLASHARFHGVLFQDDAYLTDAEDFHPAAVQAACDALGLERLDPRALTPEQKAAWTRLKTERLNALTRDLMAAVRAFRPQALFARNLYARPLHQPRSEEWYAQNFADCLALYDYTVLQAYPRVEGVWRETAWLERLVEQCAAHPGGLDRTVFKLQAYDWNRRQPVRDDTLLRWTRRLAARGARHIAYYPDNYINDRPALALTRREYSTETHLFPRPERRKVTAQY